MSVARVSITSAPVVGAAGLAALAAAHVGVDAVSGAVSVLLPILDERFALTGAEVGAMVATISVSALLAQPLAARLADRIGPKVVAAAGAIAAAGLLALLGVAGNLAVVYLLLVVGGLGSAGFHPAAAVIARRLLPEWAELAVSVFSAGGMVGLAFGPLAVLLVAAHAGLGFSPLLMLPGVAFGALLWWALPEDPPRVATPRLRDAPHLLRGPVGPLALAGTLAVVAVTTFGVGVPCG